MTANAIYEIVSDSGPHATTQMPKAFGVKNHYGTVSEYGHANAEGILMRVGDMSFVKSAITGCFFLLFSAGKTG